MDHYLCPICLRGSDDGGSGCGGGDGGGCGGGGCGGGGFGVSVFRGNISSFDQKPIKQLHIYEWKNRNFVCM